MQPSVMNPDVPEQPEVFILNQKEYVKDECERS